MLKIYLQLRFASVALLSLLMFKTSLAQDATKLNIRNFALFGGFQKSDTGLLTNPNHYGVTVNSGGVVNGGGVGSYTFIRTSSNVNVNADVYSGYRTEVGSDNNVRGSITAGLNGKFVEAIRSFSGTTFGGAPQYGSKPGDLIANGNIILNKDNVVLGGVQVPESRFYNGPQPTKGISTVSVFPQLPGFPLKTDFGANGNGAKITATKTLTPGKYSDIQIAGAKTITFNGTGQYFFNSIKSTTSTVNTFIFDLKNHVTGTFHLVVKNDVDLKNIKVRMINGGDASKILTEVLGNGSTNSGFAFAIDGDPVVNSFSNWEGTVWASASRIRVGGTGVAGDPVAVVNGCLWAGQLVRIDGFTSINFIPPTTTAYPGQDPAPLIVPYYPPPANGKNSKIIGSELQSLFENYRAGNILNDDFIYRIDRTTNKVLIVILLLL